MTGKRTCRAHKGFLDSGDQPTWVFHWTNNELALKNPKRYLEEIVRAGNEANADPGRFETGAVGLGLYLGLDPFQSLSYGKILVAFPIQPHSLFPNADTGITNGKNMPKNVNANEWFNEGCAGAVYQFQPGIKSYFEQKNLQNLNRALVLWDLGPIQSEQIVAWQTDAAHPKIFNTETASELKQLKTSSVEGQLAVLSGFVPFLNDSIETEERKLQDILMGSFINAAIKCRTDEHLVIRSFYGFFKLPFIPKKLFAFDPEEKDAIILLWKACGKEISPGSESATTFEGIVNSIDLYLNKNISSHLQKFKIENAAELDRLKQIVEYWGNVHTMEKWNPVKE